MTDDGHGRSHGRFTIPTLHAAILRKHLMAVSLGPHGRATTPPTACDGAARRPRHEQARDRTLTRHRMGLAFLHHLETRAEDAVPSAGGVPATVVVTMQLDTLLGGLRAASLDTGNRISAGEARRLACRAGIIPVVRDGASMPLDLGRRRRFHSEAQRIAMGIRDGGCRAAGCDAPPPCARHTTGSNGHAEAAPASRTATSSARDTTDGSMTPPTSTRSTSTARSASAGGRRPHDTGRPTVSREEL